MRISLASLVSGIACAAAAHADAGSGVAAAGSCAEPRQEVRTGPVEDREGFVVAGEPRRHFDPRDVAAGGLPEAALDEITTDPFESLGRGPCDAPDAGCSLVLTGEPELGESDAQPGLPPGAGGN